MALLLNKGVKYFNILYWEINRERERERDKDKNNHLIKISI